MYLKIPMVLETEYEFSFEIIFFLFYSDSEDTSLCVGCVEFVFCNYYSYRHYYEY